MEVEARGQGSSGVTCARGGQDQVGPGPPAPHGALCNHHAQDFFLVNLALSVKSVDGQVYSACRGQSSLKD